MTPEEVKKLENEAWRKGYELGVQVAIRDHKDAIKIGEAILHVLDCRYESKKEEY